MYLWALDLLAIPGLCSCFLLVVSVVGVGFCGRGFHFAAVAAATMVGLVRFSGRCVAAALSAAMLIGAFGLSVVDAAAAVVACTSFFAVFVVVSTAAVAAAASVGRFLAMLLPVGADVVATAAVSSGHFLALSLPICADAAATAAAAAPVGCFLVLPLSVAAAVAGVQMVFRAAGSAVAAVPSVGCFLWLLFSGAVCFWGGPSFFSLLSGICFTVCFWRCLSFFSLLCGILVNDCSGLRDGCTSFFRLLGEVSFSDCFGLGGGHWGGVWWVEVGVLCWRDGRGMSGGEMTGMTNGGGIPGRVPRPPLVVWVVLIVGRCGAPFPRPPFLPR